MKANWLLCVLPAVLVGCSSVGSGSPGETFNAPVTYQDVYRRAVDQANYCLRGVTGYPVSGGVDAAARTSQVLVKGDLGNTLALVDARALDDRSSEISVRMAGMNIWDAKAVKAMKAAILFGVPSCTDYMPATLSVPSSAVVK